MTGAQGRAGWGGPAEAEFLAPLAPLLEGVPAYTGFLKPDELEASARALAAGGGPAAEAAPGQAGPAAAARAPVELLELGRSRGGRPILALRLGRGPAILAYGFPHANEPVGGMTLEYLAARLAADPDLLDRLGFTWYLIKCVDPDAARLNQGWFNGPFSPLHYALHYYRQPATEQAEWGFPVSYHSLEVGQAVPEVLALQRVIDEARPVLLFSLHNSSVSGVYFWMMDLCPELVPLLHGAARLAGLPLHRGEPEHSVAPEYAPAVYRWAPISEVYDYFARHFPGDAAPLVGMGASCEEYARARGAFSLVMEVPLFAPPVIEDTAPSELTRREAAQAEIDGMREVYRFMRREFAAIAELFPPGSREATDRSFTRLVDTLRAREAYLGEAEFDRKATRAQAADRLDLRRINRMLPIGLFLRVLEGRLRAAQNPGERDRLAAAKGRLLARLQEEARELDRRVQYHVVPVQQMVRLQVACILAAAGYFQARLGG